MHTKPIAGSISSNVLFAFKPPPRPPRPLWNAITRWKGMNTAMGVLGDYCLPHKFPCGSQALGLSGDPPKGGGLAVKNRRQDAVGLIGLGLCLNSKAIPCRED